ncbi:hypothetical protein [uncultured Tenacibaculum sp.]|uniref:hypothetical protein n=1 Tax=uncultured Tenacibaculum sp. TaxID=174713 RepID=UPI00261C76D3|nr:hypothetical protein [uncultured Tenacibaculum sp.]
MNLKQILLFLALIIMSNQSQAQTIYLDANIEYLSCDCKGSIDSSPICGYDLVDKSISMDEQIIPCVPIKNIKKDYKRYQWETFEIVLDEKASVITKKLGETSEVYHIQKQEVDDNNKKHFTLYVTNEKGEKTRIYLDLKDNFITFYNTKDGKYSRSHRHKFRINYSKIYKENEKKN